MWTWLALGWVVGIACMGRVDLWWTPQIEHLFFLASILGVLLVFRHYMAVYGMGLVLGLTTVLMGYAVGYGYAEQKLLKRLDQRITTMQSVEGLIYIKKINELNEQGVQQRIDWIEPNGNDRQGITFLNPQQAQQFNFSLGQYYWVSAELRPIHGFAVAGVFDQEQWALQQNIMFRMQIKSVRPLEQSQVLAFMGAQHLKRQQRKMQRFSLWMEQQRLALRDFIGRSSLKNKGLMLGLLTGDKSHLTDEVEIQFRRMGMSHLLAISGPHVLVFATLVCWGIRKGIEKKRPQWFLKIPRQIVLVAPFLFCVAIYCVFVGAEIPALRTLFMCSILALTLLFGLPLKPLSVLLCSACLLLFFDPFSVLSAAFWLSYGACFILLRIYQTIQNTPTALQGRQKYRFIFKVLVESQWKIFIALLPLMIIFFQHVAWIAPLTNILAIPWLGLLVVPLDILAACLYFIFEPLALVLFHINDVIISALLLFLNVIDHVFDPQLIPIAFRSEIIYCLILVLIIVFLPQGVVPKAWAGLAALPILSFGQIQHPLQVSVLDVAQGQAIFIQDQGKSLMIDVGGRPNEKQAGIGERVIIPFLLNQGVAQLDQVILTHLDQDHSGAFAVVAKQMQPKHLIANEKTALSTGYPFDYCFAGQHWVWTERIEIQVLSPRHQVEQRLAEERNEQSCVIYMKIKDAQPYQSFLFMADAGWQTEYWLMQRYPELKVDVLVLGHHGSKHSSAYDFLKHYQPKLALVSAGYANRYQHPTAITQARLKALGIPLYSTIQHGTLTFIQQDHQQINLMTQRSKRMWLMR